MALDAAAPADAPPARRNAPDWLILTIACVAQFMVILDVSIVNVALPSIRTSLGFSPSGLQWVLNAYTLTFAGFLLLGGRAADIFGRRRIFMLGLLVFTAASLFGGFAQDQAMLITARSVQGLGGAILSPATLTILTTTFTEPKARARAMGLWSAVAGAGGAAGALLGGVLTQELSWRWILFINVPVGIAALFAAGAFLQETRSAAARKPLDIAGAVMVTSGLTALVYGLVRTTSVGWTSWQTIVALAAAAALLVWFVAHEAKVATDPLMPLGMLRRRSIWSANLTMLLFSGSLFAMWYFVSLYLQEVRGYSPLRTGFAFLPQTLAIIAGSQVAARLMLRLGASALLVVGTLCSAGGLLWLGMVGLHTAYWTGFFVPSVMVALGLGLSFSPLAFAATRGVAPREQGLASGLVNTARQIGGAMGLAALATIATSRTQDVLRAGAGAVAHSATALPLALTSGYTEAFRVSAFIALAATIAALLVPGRGSSPQGSEALAGSAAHAEPPASAAAGVGQVAIAPD
jgi:EmrB/QacA subfamily drug resistance transporter